MAVYECNHSVESTRANAFTYIVTFIFCRKGAALHCDARLFSLKQWGCF